MMLAEIQLFGSSLKKELTELARVLTLLKLLAPFQQV